MLSNSQIITIFIIKLRKLKIGLLYYHYHYQYQMRIADNIYFAITIYQIIYHSHSQISLSQVLLSFTGQRKSRHCDWLIYHDNIKILTKVQGQGGVQGQGWGQGLIGLGLEWGGVRVRVGVGLGLGVGVGPGLQFR